MARANNQQLNQQLNEARGQLAEAQNQLADLFDRMAAVEGRHVPIGGAAAPYVSPYGTPVPVLPNAPFSNTSTGDRQEDRLKQHPKMLFLKSSMSKLQLRSDIMLSIRSCAASTVTMPRIDFMMAIARELEQSQILELEDWIQGKFTKLSGDLPLSEEVNVLHQFIDLMTRLCCNVLSPQDALQQLKDIKQEAMEGGEKYTNRAIQLCKQASRCIVKNTLFSDEELTVVTENLVYIIKGLRNPLVRNMAMVARPLFTGHSSPTADELKRQMCGHILSVKAEFKDSSQPKKRHNLVGLKWKCTDTCLAERFDSKDESYSVVEPLEDFNAMQVGPSHIFCGRCGRKGHLVYTCRAKTTAAGEPVEISSEDWLKTFKSARGTMEGRPAAPKGRNGSKKKFSGSPKQPQQVASVSDCPAAPQPPAPVVEPDF